MKDKKIPLYAVVLKKDPRMSFTITQTKEQAFEYVETRVQRAHQEHFNMWCELHGHKLGAPESWELYKCNVLSEDDFKECGVIKVKFPLSKIVPMIRMYFGYLPIGCSFDDAAEIETVLKSVDEETAKKIQEQIQREEAKLNGDQQGQEMGS